MKSKLILFLILLTSLSYSQTIIKEKVRVTKNSFNSTQQKTSYMPCDRINPYIDGINYLQYVWTDSKYPLHPGRQNIGNYVIEENEYYTFRIIQGAEYCYFIREYFNEYENPPQVIHNEITVLGRDLMAKDSEGNVINDSIKFIDCDKNPYYVSMYHYDYTIVFGEIPTEEEEVIYTVESRGSRIVVHTHIKKATHTIYGIVSRDTIMHGEENIVDIISSRNECPVEEIFCIYNGSRIYDDEMFYIEILEGSEYGNLYDAENNYLGRSSSLTYKEIRKGLYFITEEGENPEEGGKVRIRISTMSEDIMPKEVIAEFYIKHNPNSPAGIEIIFEKNVIRPGESTEIILKERTEEGEIKEFDEDELFNVEIIRGYRYGDLYSYSENRREDYFYNVRQGFRFIAEEEIPKDTVEVEIYASTAGGILLGKSQPINKKTKERVVTQSNEKILEGIGKILIVKKNLIKLELNASPDTIETGEKSTIKVRLINKEGEEITISDETEITLTLDEEGSRLGRLESRNNSGQTITVRAEEIKNGEVKYIANDTIQNPNALIKINNKERLKVMGNEEIKGIATITATMIYEGEEIEGNTKIAIKEADKKIEIILEPEEVRPLGTGGNNKTKVKVKVTRSGKGVKDIGIELRAEAEEGSGGHDHRGNRPAGKFKDNITVGKTDENGVYETEYTASEFGGIEKIVAKIAGSGKETEVKLTVRVGGLELLPESPYYVKIGGTCNHHGPSDRGIPMECMDKDNNHWGTLNVIKNIENIAKEYKRIFPNISLLAINDISLPNGGKFDINGQWKGSHTYHRAGLDVDIRSTNMLGDRFIDRNRNDEYDEGDILTVDINGNGKYDNNVMPTFKSIAEDYGVYKVNLEYPGRNNEHWHLYFWDINRR